MAMQDGKKIILTDAVNEAAKNKPHDSIEQASYELFGDMPTLIEEAKRKGKQKHNTDFFIEILIKFEKFAGDAVHPYINVTRSCPRPHYKQVVMHYDKEADKLKLLWTLPDFTHAALYRLDPLRFPRENVQFLLDHDDGKLTELSQNINKDIKE